MGFVTAAASLGLGTIGAVFNRKSALEKVKDHRRVGKEALLTAAWNTRERNKWARYTSFEVLDAGTAKFRETAIAGKTAEASAKATAASSGAVVGSGTPRAVLSAIVQEAVDAQTQVLLDTNRNLKAIQYDTENQNKSEWRSAELYKNQQDKIASNTDKASKRQFITDMLGAGMSAYTAGSTAAGTGDISKWGIDAAKTAGTVKEIKGSGGRRDMSRTNAIQKYNVKSKPYGKGYTDMQKTKLATMKPTKGDWGKYGKIRPTGGKESSKTWDRWMHNIKHGTLDLSGAFDIGRIKHAMGIGKRVNYGKMGRTYNYLKGK